jgi:hypothetical protein
VKDYTLTLTGSAQALSSVLTNAALDLPFQSLHLQPDGANANPVYVGTSSSVSSSSHGVRLPAAAGGVPPAPYIFEFSGEGRLRLSAFYVLGTNTEKLHILGLER